MKTSTVPRNARRATNEELADLPDRAEKWNNFSEDPSKYYVCFGVAWVVNEEFYNECLRQGYLCIKWKGKYYVATGGRG